MVLAQASSDWIGVYEGYLTIPPEHDVGIKSIDSPESGYAYADIPMKITLKNYGAEDRVTAESKDFTYYLISPELSEILSEK